MLPQGPQPFRVRIVTLLALALAAVLLTAPQAAAAIRGKVKDIKDTGSGYVGIVVDEQTGEDVPFVQPRARELGIVKGSIVTFERVMPFGEKDPVAVLLHLAGNSPLDADKGKVIVIRDNGSGLVEDRKTGKPLPFEQPYSKELGITVGDQVRFFVLPQNGGAVLAKIVNTSRSNIRNIVMQLDGGSPVDLVSFEGGQLVPDYAFDNTAPFQYRRWTPGKPQYENITIAMPMNPDAVLAAWIGEALSGKVGSRKGHMIVFDDDRDEVARLSFTDALISEVRLPAIDATAKDTSYLTVVITPGTVSMTSDAGFQAGTAFKINPKKHKPFLPCNFRIRIDNTSVSRVNKIGVFVAKQRIPKGHGAFPAYYLITDPNLTDGVTTEFSGVLEAGPFEEGVRLALQGIDIDHAVDIEYLNDDGDVLLTVKQRLGLFKLTPEKVESHPDELRVRMVGNRDAVVFVWPKK